MSGTIKIIAICTATLLLAAAAVLASPTPVTKLQLSREGSFTVLTIEGEGQIRTAHQSVEAKEGKPFRIVVDCLASRHAMKDKAFENLPTSAITAIRTSQYAVTPEEVVRVVLDLQEESVYRVQELPNAVKVFVSDPMATPFAVWTSDNSPATPKTPEPKKVAAVTAPNPVQDKPVVSAPPVVASTATTQKKMPSIIKAHKQAAKEPSVTSEPVMAQKNTTVSATPEPKPSAVEKQTVAKAETEPEKWQKPVPLQVKLGLTTDDAEVVAAAPTKDSPKAETKSVPAVTASKPETKQTPAVVVSKPEVKPAMKPATTTAATPPKPTAPQTAVAKTEPAKSETKVQPTVAQANPETAKKTQEPKAVPTVPQTNQPVVANKPAESAPVAKTQEPRIRIANILNDTIDRVLTFAAIINKDISVPPPGDLPKKPGAPSTDIHKAPAKESKPAAKTETTKVKETVLASVTTDTKAIPGSPGEPKQIASLPSPGKQATQPTASPVTEQTEEPEVVSKRPSRFRRDAAKSARLREAQVVQFPQRIVIKYKGATGRDPFQTLIDIEKKTRGVDLNKIPNIETLHLVGVLEARENGGKDAALMEDLDGIGYILKTGDRVRNGYVAQIDEQAVYFQINEYGWSRTVVKALEKEK